MFYANYMRERMKVPIYAETECNPIVITNALERPLRDINIFGESTQDGTPTPDAPVDIVSVESPVVTVTGKNLFDINNLQYIASSQWALTNYKPKVEDGIFYNGGNAYAVGIGAFVWVYCGKRPCTISFEVIDGGDGDYYTQFMLSEFPSIPSNSIYANHTILVDKRKLYNKKYSFSVKPTQDYIGFAFMHNNTKYVIKATDIQIEFGDTATEYEPYVAPQSVNLDGITLRGLKDSQGSWKARDEIKVDGKKKTVTFVKRCWEICLDGGAGWAKYDNVSGFEGFMLSRNTLPEKYNRRTPAFCNQCRVNYNTMWIGVSNKLVYWVGPEARKFYDASLEDKGLANLKAHLNENPLKIVSYYDEPIETDMTNTEAGQKLLELYTNKGTTNISLNSESDLGEIWVRYVRK